MTRPVSIPAPATQLHWFLRVAALVLFIIAAIIAFWITGHFDVERGLVYVGLACLTASFL